jgi:hypothetical protein
MPVSRLFEATQVFIGRGRQLLLRYLNIDQMGDGATCADRGCSERDPVREAMSLQNNWTKGAESQTQNRQE